MSLNGLDDVSVTQAYQGALAEAGGWCAGPNLSARSDSVLTFEAQVPAEVYFERRG